VVVRQDRPYPVEGVDYPRTIREFDKWFSSETSCATYLRRLRWPDGFRCPVCGWRECLNDGKGPAPDAQPVSRRHRRSAKTILEGTRKPLRTWFQAICFVTNQKSGGSALGLQRILGLGTGFGIRVVTVAALPLATELRQTKKQGAETPRKGVYWVCGWAKKVNSCSIT
jgi:hypothetical protein